MGDRDRWPGHRFNSANPTLNWQQLEDGKCWAKGPESWYILPQNAEAHDQARFWLDRVFLGGIETA